MVVDYVRSCYGTTCRFFKDAPERLEPIYWYFTDPAALELGVPNVIASRNWLDATEPEWPVGELRSAPRVWFNGRMPRRPAGLAFDGLAADFAAGADFSAGRTLARNLTTGIPLNCQGLVVNVCVLPGQAMPHAVVSGTLRSFVLHRVGVSLEWSGMDGFGGVTTWQCLPGGMQLQRNAGPMPWLTSDGTVPSWTYASNDGFYSPNGSPVTVTLAP
jgi:hypothetical protein